MRQLPKLPKLLKKPSSRLMLPNQTRTRWKSSGNSRTARGCNDNQERSGKRHSFELWETFTQANEAFKAPAAEVAQAQSKAQTSEEMFLAGKQSQLISPAIRKFVLFTDSKMNSHLLMNCSKSQKVFLQLLSKRILLLSLSIHFLRKFQISNRLFSKKGRG